MRRWRALSGSVLVSLVSATWAFACATDDVGATDGGASALDAEIGASGGRDAGDVGFPVGVAGGSATDAGLDVDAAPPESDGGLEERISDAVRSIESDTCSAEADASACEWADYEIAPGHFDMART